MNKPSALYFYIGQAAIYLGVSVDTLRRWEEKGKLVPFRTAGGTRFYSKEALENFKTNLVANPELEYSISEAAKKLGVSVKTLRRWDSDGKLVAQRNEKGQRVYTQQDFEKPNQPQLVKPALLPNHSFHKEPIDLFNIPELKKDSPLLFVKKTTIPGLTWTPALPEMPIVAKQPEPEARKPRSHFQKMALGTLLTTLFFGVLVEIAVLLYSLSPAPAKEFFASRPVHSPLTSIAELASRITQTLSPPLIGLLSQRDSTELGSHNEPINVLAASISRRILELNGDLKVNGTINDLTVSTASSSGTHTLTVTANDVTLDQNLSTVSSPSFRTLDLTSTANQMLFSSGSIGTLTWTPTTARTVTVPDATGTVVLDSATQTLTNKTISGSSNTFSNIANSALSNSKVAVTAGTNMSGGGDVSLGSSVTLSLASSPAISGVLTLADGTAAAPGLAFTSDTNSGLYRLGTDKIGLITGGIATQGITIDATGQIGIGTITPGAALEVAGQVKITGGTPGTNKVLTSDADGLASWVSLGTAGGITGVGTSGYLPKFTSSSNIATSNLFDDGASIGIGNTAPGATLDVTGTGRFSSTLTATSGFDSNAASTVAGLTVDGDGNLTVSNGTLSVTAPTTTGNAAAVTANSLTTGTALDLSSTSTVGGESGTSTMLKMTRSGTNANTAHTAYGLYSTVANTNVTSGTNIAGYFSASGATTANYGLIVNSGNVGMGTTAPASFKLEVAGNIGPEANNTRDLGSTTRYFANAYVTNLKTGTSGEVGYWSRTSTTLSPVTAGDSVSVTGSYGSTPATNSTALNLTGTNVTSANLAYFNAKNTSGTIFNIAYGAAATLAGDLVGQAIDLNNGQVSNSNYSVTGLKVTLPTVSNTNTSGTSYVRGFQFGFGNGTGIVHNGAGGATVYSGVDISLPDLTQSAGTLTANGFSITTPSSITTGGTANAINISATGVGVGTLTGLNIGSIATPLGGTETAIGIGTSWDNVLKVGSTTVINGSGVTQVAGGGTGMASYAIGDLIYASTTTALSSLVTGGAGNDGRILVISGGIPTWVASVGGGICANCVLNNPTAVTTQTITPTTNISSLVVRQTTYGTPTKDIFVVASEDYDGAEIGSRYFYVDSSGNVSTGGIASQTLTLTPASDTTALTLVGTNVSTANLQYINAKNLQGTILNMAYGAAATLNDNQTLTGQAINLSTNITANASSTNTKSITGSSITLPGPSNTNTSGTNALKGLVVSAGSGINQNGAGGTTTFTGVDITIPALTQTAGSITGNGILVTTPSSISLGGTANGINIAASEVGAGFLNGINISGIGVGDGTETALNVGSGWDYAAIFASGKVGIGTTAPTATLQVGGNQSLASWGTNGTGLQVATATYTDNTGSGVIATGVANSFARPTFAAASAVTISDAATVYIDNSPLNGTNMSITRPYSLWVATGNSRFGQNVSLDDGQYLKFGNTDTASENTLLFGYRPASSDVGFIGLKNASGDLPLVIAQSDAYDSTNFAQTRTTNPTLYIQSAINPNVTNNEWGSFAHNQTGFVITTGANIGVGTTAATIDNYIAFAPRGTERVRIDGTGNVGIGDDSPDYQLELYDATNTPTFALSDDDIAHGVTGVVNTDTFFHLSSISTTDGGAYLQGLADNVVGATALQFRGIQASDPTDTVPAIKLIGAKASGTGVVDLGAAETVFQVANNDDTAALTILGDGKVGIGTTAPSALLSVGSTSQFQVSTLGAVTAVGLNSGSGLTQGTGGLTVSGNITLAATAGNTVGIGNSTGAMTLASGGTSAWTNTAGNLTISTATSGTLALTSIGALNLSAGAASTWTLANVANALNIDSNTVSIDALNNRVGIGLTNPTYKLDALVSADDAIQIRSNANAVGASVALIAQNDAGVYSSLKGFGSAAGTTLYGQLLDNWSLLENYRNGDVSGLVIGTRGYDNPILFGTNNIERMRLTSAGLGIGTTAPTANLQVAQGTAGVGTVSNDAGGTTVTGVGTQFLNTFKVGDTITINAETVAISAIASNTSMTTAAITGANSAVAYTLTGGTRFSVLGNGNVGIGTTSPTSLLSVGSTSQFQVNTSGYVLLPNGLVGTPSLAFTGDPDTGIWTSGANTLNFSTGAAERLRIDSNGNAVLGAAANSLNAVQKLTVYSANTNFSDYSQVLIASNDVMAADKGGYIALGGIYTGNPSLTNVADFAGIAGRKENAINTNTAGYLTLGTRPAGGGVTERLRITSTGNVGIGTTTPTAKLEAVAGTTSSGAITLTAANEATTFTTSGSITINNGDYIIPTTTTAQARAVTVGGTGTSFTVATAFTADVTAETFTIYHPVANLANSLGTSKLFVQGSTGNVGIGVTAPQSALDVTTGLRIYNAARTNYTYLVTDTGGGSEGVTLIGNSAGKVVSNTDGGFSAYLFKGPNSTFVMDNSRGATYIGNKFEWGTNTTSTTSIFQFAPKTGSAGQLTATSGTQTWFSVEPTINQSDTAGYTALLVKATETGVGSGTKLLQDWQVGTTSKASIDNTGALTAIGVNSGAGLIQGTGGLTVSGNTTLAATAGNTVGIGNSTGAMTLASGGTSAWTNTAGNLTISTATSGTLALTSIGALNLSAGAASTWTLANVANALNIDSNTVSIDALNNRVGIGLTNPTYKIDTLVSADDAIQIRSNAVGASVVLIAQNDAGVYSSLKGFGSAAGTTLYGQLLDSWSLLESYNTGAGGLVVGTRGADNPIIFGTNNVERMRLTSAGLGIGSTNPVNKLKVVGSLCVKADDAACAGSTAGTIYATTTTIADADLAENYISSQTLEPGEIVTTSSDNNNQAVEKSVSGYQRNIMGIISTKPGITLNSSAATDSAHPNLYPVALAGRVPLKVSTENGAITRGDFLTSSSIPGVAMKATRPGQMIAKALEPFDSAQGGQGRIEVFINVTFADPGNFLASLTLDDQGNLIVPNLKVNKLAIDSEIKLGGTNITALENLVAYESTNSATISATLATVQDQVASTSAQLASASAQLAQVKSDVDTLKLTPPETLLATGSATLANLNVTSDASISGKLVAYQATISDTFKALGETFLGNTMVAGDFTVDGTLSLTGSSLNTIGTLYIQDSSLAENIDLFAGKVTIDKNGQLIAQKILAPEIVTNKLTISNTPIASSSSGVSSGSPEVAGASIGTAILPAHASAITILTPEATDSAKVFITPISITDKVLSVTDVVNGESFDVSVLTPPTADIKFNWWIVGTR